MAAARPAWEQALVDGRGAPRYAHWGFGDVVDPRQEMQGIAGMTRFMTFFRDHPDTDRAVVAFSGYARVLDAEYALVLSELAAGTITEDVALRTFVAESTPEDRDGRQFYVPACRLSKIASQPDFLFAAPHQNAQPAL